MPRRKRQSAFCMRWLSGRGVALFLVTGVAGPSIWAQNFQTWNEIDFTGSWRNVDFLAPLLARTDTQLPNPQFAATGIMADIQLPRHFTVTGGFLFVDLPPYST